MIIRNGQVSRFRQSCVIHLQTIKLRIDFALESAESSLNILDNGTEIAVLLLEIMKKYPIKYYTFRMMLVIDHHTTCDRS